MRYLFLILSFFMGSVVMAQFTFNGKVGVNAMHIWVTKTKIPDYNYSNGLGWQIGGNVEYQTSSQIGFFLYMGAAFRHSSNDRDSAHAAVDTGNLYRFRPNFLCIPYGIGYKFPLKNPDLKLKVYFGLNPQIGLGGKLKSYHLYYNDPAVDVQKKLYDTRKLSYGDKATSKDFSYDYASANWGLQAGVGLDLSKTAEVEILFCQDFTNGLPGKRRTDEISKFSFLDLNFKLDIPNKNIKLKK